MARKITEDSQILTRGEAIILMNGYVEKEVHDTKKFKDFIVEQLADIILIKKYYNEDGIKAMGKLLTKGVETEVHISSESDGRKKYRCVKFEDGSYGCTCTSFLTYHNVTKPKGQCKHIKTLIANKVF